MQKKGISSLWQCQIFWFEFIQTDKSSTFLGTNILLIFILQSCSKIWPNPQRLWIIRLRLKFSCMMELSDYPLDRQICGMQISSCKPHLTNKIKHTKQQNLLIAWSYRKPFCQDRNPHHCGLIFTDISIKKFCRVGSKWGSNWRHG